MRAILFVLVTLLLVGCSGKETITYRYLETTFEDHWFDTCTLTPPPDREAYMAASDRARAVMFSRAYAQQIEEVGQCNVRLKNAREHNQRLIERNEQVKAGTPLISTEP